MTSNALRHPLQPALRSAPSSPFEVRGGGAALPYSTEYTTPGTQTIAIPSGAASVTIEAYAAGASADPTQSGGGGAYSSRVYSTSGLTGIYISVPATPALEAAGGDAFARADTSGGTVLCLAKGGGTGANLRTGGAAASGTGDTKNSGGNGVLDVAVGGGGGAGPSGNGSNGTSGGGGAGGGGVAGAGGSILGYPGLIYGGGGGARDVDEFGVGAQGYIKLSWAAASKRLLEDGTSYRLIEGGTDRRILES